MIKHLLYKEFRLNIYPWMYGFFAFPLLLLVPAWPFFVALAYFFLLVLIIAQTDKANQDLAFGAGLPIPKSGVVTARTWTLVILEVAQVLFAAVVAVGRYWLYSKDNSAGMNVNLAFFGLIFVMYAVFNLIYLPGAYSRPYRMLWPILGGSMIAVLVGGVATTLVCHAFAVGQVPQRPGSSPSRAAGGGLRRGPDRLRRAHRLRPPPGGRQLRQGRSVTM